MENKSGLDKQIEETWHISKYGERHTGRDPKDCPTCYRYEKDISQAVQESRQALIKEIEEKVERLHRSISDYTDAEYRANFESEVGLILTNLREERDDKILQPLPKRN